MVSRVLLGVLSATHPGSRLDRLSQVIAMVGISMPAFWVGLLLIIGFSVKLGWLPGTGMYAPVGDGGPRDLLAHLILPAVTLSLVPLAIVFVPGALLGLALAERREEVA